MTACPPPECHNAKYIQSKMDCFPRPYMASCVFKLAWIGVGHSCPIALLGQGSKYAGVLSLEGAWLLVTSRWEDYGQCLPPHPIRVLMLRSQSRCHPPRLLAPSDSCRCWNSCSNSTSLFPTCERCPWARCKRNVLQVKACKFSLVVMSNMLQSRL